MREIYIVSASQVVITEAHPEGLYSVISSYPKVFDSRNYGATESNPNGDAEKAFRVAKAEYLDRLAQLYPTDNRAMWTVTLTRVDGRQIMSESYGSLPDMTPETEEEEESESE